MRPVTENAETTFNSIKVDWQALTTFDQTGGTMSIISYSVEMNDSITNTWRALVGADTSYYTQFSWTESGLTTG